MVSTRKEGASAGEPVTGARVLIVEGRYYEALADELLAGARAALEAAGATVDVITVPGALEIPIAAEIALEAAEEEDEPYEAVVALGCVIRGETYHFEIVAGESSRGLMDLALAHALPLGNGILTVETEAQAWERARVGEGNKGGGAAEAALSLVRLKRRGLK
ncbi:MULTISPECIES: 6,7-dimethyl-8-ribityllumazine synthase [Azorhizobium]|jgi:6,7-dimethyl-8-ribityllumazine synthase|uniref:6,7-dimethyl-8-ribityllumazine synthase n=1 Tax=Azorhizobium caulinodans (strain ATCC 43989 / DSM 5975 / JCM 20966 / LMG 6465 / NBRC 14845 / NCIMB 13405 / ORS 571) TaxID=438753 RepID=RISB_AZOC5|nr:MULTISPECIES: 6,7-dimethyl-8-ribityllumazine synthase [Azorhizobium]A8I0J5.1 RecName: Full=6,7-dimethyl-8-ribityllumazine synthase; Short=DMRL synthase; Short=LS; Short=Lumazine synthase [Azorhizobium caulinodans ORS 571]TDT92522.1 6,7-dimethyl-8-ribityllumazine synthase [Azorhizobium sp. AG788]BAF87263.1 riboflavin synthase beta chain [Azorhizobium caulinodans ORS 571]